MARTRILRAGCSSTTTSRNNAGFTLFELLVVMVILAMTVVAVSALYRSPSNGTQVKATALLPQPLRITG